MSIRIGFTTLVALATIVALPNTLPFASARAQDTTATSTRPDSTAVQTLTPEQRAEARRAGEALAAKQGGWFGRSAGLGLLTAYVGPAIIIPIAAISSPTPPDSIRKQLAAKGPVYQATFEKAYSRKVRVKRVWTSVAGSVVGMTACVGLIMLSWNS